LLYACAAPTSAGTFALFAYYNGPIEPAIKVKKIFTVGDWDIGFRTTNAYLDITHLFALDVNWQDTTPHQKARLGMRMCWDEKCREDIDKSIDINPTSYPYPQHFDAPIIDKYASVSSPSTRTYLRVQTIRSVA
jgi:hypothetical protein